MLKLNLSIALVNVFRVHISVARLQVLDLGGHFLRDQFMNMLDSFLAECGVTKNHVTTTLKQALDEVVTQEHRQRNLERFFRVVFAQVGMPPMEAGLP